MLLPIVEFAGIKLLPVTPLPLHVPPLGVKPVSATWLAFVQILKPLPAFAVCGLATVATIVSLFTQPFASVKVYIKSVVPTPAVDGLNEPVLVTPVPVQIPPL